MKLKTPFAMHEIKDDVLKYWEWARKEFESEEIEFYFFEVQSSIKQLNRYINNEFKAKALGKDNGLRTK